MMRNPRRLWIGAALLFVVMAAAFLWWPRHAEQPEFHRGDIVVSAPWARATPGGMTIGAAYFTIVNGGSTPDRLLRVETAAAERVDLHTTIVRDAVTQMRSIDSMPLPPGQAVTFGPGGMHLMLVNLAAPLEEGSRFGMRLIFERAGVLDVEVTVGAIGAANGH